MNGALQHHVQSKDHSEILIGGVRPPCEVHTFTCLTLLGSRALFVTLAGPDAERRRRVSGSEEAGEGHQCNKNNALMQLGGLRL